MRRTSSYLLPYSLPGQLERPAPPLSFLCFSSVLSLTVTYLYSSLCLFFAMKHPTLTDEEASRCRNSYLVI